MAYVGEEVLLIENGELGFLRHGINEKTENGIDVGCGSMKVLNHAIGVDVARMETTDFSKPNVTRAEWVGNGHELPFKNETLDYVVSKHVLEHLEWQQALTEWTRCLKKDGMLRLIVPNPDSPDHPGHGIPRDEVSAYLTSIGCEIQIEINTYDNFSWGLAAKKL